MKHRFIFLTILLISLAVTSEAQIHYRLQDTVSFLGKRKNIIWGRNIASENLGNMWYTYYYPLYFRSKINSKTRRVGLFGQNIKPYFENNYVAMDYFKEYRLKKSLSYITLPASMGCLFGWVYTAAENRVYLEDTPFRSLTHPIPLTFLAGYLALFYTGMYINTDADIDLLTAVQLAQGKTPKRFKQKYKAKIDVGRSTQSILGIHLDF